MTIKIPPQNKSLTSEQAPGSGAARLRRSVLFMPATNQRAIAKATQLDVDAIILDLEDSVLPTQKSAARDAMSNAIKTHDFAHREVLVRINGLDTEWWRQDLLAAMNTSAHGIVVPKIESPDQVLAIVSAMQASSQSTQAVLKSLWVMLETPTGILASAAICNADPNLSAVLIGTADLGKELHLPDRADRLGLLPSLGQVVLAAKAAGLTVVDGVYMNIDDSVGLEFECEQGVALGFDGKSLIHPAQLPVANRVFAPSALELENACQIQAAWQQSLTTGEGVCLLNNRLVEHLHVRRAEELLATAELIKQRLKSIP